MLYIPPDEVEVIRARDGIQCVHCEERTASWKMEPKGGGAPIPLCGWCVLYGGSEWGHKNRDELAYSGKYVQGVGGASESPNSSIPMLDDRHRLSAPDAEKYVMGIMFTSKMLTSRMKLFHRD